MESVDDIRRDEDLELYDSLVDESEYDGQNTYEFETNSGIYYRTQDPIVQSNGLSKNFTENSPEQLPTTPSEYLMARYISEYERPGDLHIEVYNNWLINYVEGNIRSKFLRMQDGSTVRFENLQRIPPTDKSRQVEKPLTPQAARNQGKSYSSEWYVDVVRYTDDTFTEVIESRKDRNKMFIGKIPVMLKSSDCILNGKNRMELSLLGEDPEDPGGYFIVFGSEKVVLLQEQLAVNKIFVIEPSSKDKAEVHITANTSRGTAVVRLVIGRNSGQIRIRLPSIKPPRQENVKIDKAKKQIKSINVLRIFRLLGLTEIDEIQQLISRFIPEDRLEKSLYHLGLNIIDFYTVPNDVDYIITKKWRQKDVEDPQTLINQIINTDIFPHVDSLPALNDETVQERNERIREGKLNLLAIMVAKFLQYQAGYKVTDDRDSWSNKRIEGAGRVMEQLFRNAWRSALDPIQSDIKNGVIKNINEIMSKADTIYNTITETFNNSFNTSNWGVKGYKTKTNVAQTLARGSTIETQAHMATIDVGVSRRGRDDNPRKIQPSQYGFIDPVSTPESANCGLVKNLAVLAKASLSRSDQIITRYLLGDTEKGWEPQVFPYDLRGDHKHYLMINGKFLGWCDGLQLKNTLIESRRTGYPLLLPRDISIILQGDWLYIDLSPSRVVRPLLIVDEETQQLVIDQLKLRDANFNELFLAGAIELMSSWEQETIKVATSTHDINERLNKIRDYNNEFTNAKTKLEMMISNGVDQTSEEFLTAKDNFATTQDRVESLKNNRKYTHCEFDRQDFLGPASILTPYSNHNQAPRNTYQVSMGKQALGNYNNNHRNRFDGTIKLLSTPQRPMVENKMYEVYGLDNRGSGENITVAFMSYPFTEEDAFVVKKEFLENSGFRIFKYFTYKTVLTGDGANVIEYLTKPTTSGNEVGNPYRHLRDNGLPYIGAYLESEDCVIGKVKYDRSTNVKEDESVYLGVGDVGIVDKVIVSNSHKGTLVQVKMRLYRVPQEGDKFAPRNAQKGTCGRVISERFLPYSSSGIAPDFIINPTSFPSRMTSSYQMEMVAAKAGAYFGGRINGGSFANFEFNKYRNTLKKYREFLNAFEISEEDFGDGQFSYETMFSGLSGEPLEGLIFMGPVFFQALKHHVADKNQCRSQGAVKPVTHQPSRGRKRRGGLKYGEMERDACISHGATSIIQERLMYVSDGYQAVFCRDCGEYADCDPTLQTNRYFCAVCDGDSEVGTYTIPYATKYFKHILGAMNIGMNPVFIDENENNRVISSEPKVPKQIVDDDDVLDTLGVGIDDKDIIGEAERNGTYV